jgi:hypothetical protein
VKRNVTGPDGFICKPLALRMHPDGLEAPTPDLGTYQGPVVDFIKAARELEEERSRVDQLFG